MQAAAQTTVILQIPHKSQLCQGYAAPASLCYWSKLVTLSMYYFGKTVHGQQAADSFPQLDWEIVSCETAENISWNMCWNIIPPVRWRYICFYLMTMSMPFHKYGDVASVACLMVWLEAGQLQGWYWIIGLQRYSWQVLFWQLQLYTVFVGQTQFAVWDNIHWSFG